MRASVPVVTLFMISCREVNHTVMLLAGISGESKLQQQMTEVLALLKSKPDSKPRAISNVGSAEADSILFELDFLQEDGNLACPIVVPAGSPSCCPFDYSQHPSEDAGTPALLSHHQLCLHQFGVHFGRGGFQMHDVHGRKKDLQVTAPSGLQYNGGVDGIAAPYALTKAGAFSEMRIAYEHKQSDAQKQLYREAHPHQFKVCCVQKCGHSPLYSIYCSFVYRTLLTQDNDSNVWLAFIAT